MIRMRYALGLEGVTADEGPIGVLMHKGDASGTEVQNGINHKNTAGPDDTTQMANQSDSMITFNDTLRMFRMYDGGTRGQLHTGWIKLAKRGIPMPEGTGWAVSAYNADSSALTTGALVKGIVQYQGVWLRD